MIKAVMNLVPKASGWLRFSIDPMNKCVVQSAASARVYSWISIDALDVVLMADMVMWAGFVVHAEDRDIASEALEKVGMLEFAKRQISQLSGGQQQRVFLARALAQDARIYMMDEPFAGVDASTEKAIIDLLVDLRRQGKTILVVHHDLQTVTEYFDWVIMLNMRVVSYGRTKEVFTDENLQKTYGGRLTVLSQAAQAMADQRRGG